MRLPKGRARGMRIPRRQRARDSLLAKELRRGVNAAGALLAGKAHRLKDVRRSQRRVTALIQSGAVPRG